MSTETNKIKNEMRSLVRQMSSMVRELAVASRLPLSNRLGEINELHLQIDMQMDLLEAAAAQATLSALKRSVRSWRK